MADFSQARLAYKQCTKGIDLLLQSKTLEEYEERYKEVLHSMQRIYNKVKNTLKGHPRSSSLLGKYIHDREVDPLLLYFKQARNSDEHTIADLTKREPGGLGINQAKGKGLYVDHLEIRNGRIVSYRGDPIKVTIIPSRVVPITVTTRDGVFPVPQTHLGASISGQPLDKLLSVALKYYDTMLMDLEKNA